jgi:hypothetical protein
MLDAAQRELHTAGVIETPGVLLADAGYWHQRQMERIVDRGIPVLIPPDASKRRGARPGWDGGLYAFMRRKSSARIAADAAMERGSGRPCRAHRCRDSSNAGARSR